MGWWRSLQTDSQNACKSKDAQHEPDQVKGCLELHSPSPYHGVFSLAVVRTSKTRCLRPLHILMEEKLHQESDSIWVNLVIKMRKVLLLASCLFLTAYPAAAASPPETPPDHSVATIAETETSLYFWGATPVGSTANLVTLFCRGCAGSGSLVGEADVPLIAILRDTLADDDPENDRLTALWLLTYASPSVVKQVLSAVPFFYWRAGQGSGSSRIKRTVPLLDLTALQHPMLNTAGRDILQWAILDPSTMPLRASSRAYRANQADHERLHLEEAISYLRAAPSGTEGVGLTFSEIHTLIARLQLRKTLLAGGFVSERAAAKLGEEADNKYERIRSRNWELLRQCADKGGLYFESLDIAGTSGQYAILWYPGKESSPPRAEKLSSIWKLLNIKDPWKDQSLNSPGVVSYSRELDQNGNLLPSGVSGVKEVKLVPLSVYGLSYPKLPLLLVNFRDKLGIRWHEMAQRSINEVTAGVIGISHFTNWYYYVAADLYDFVVSRHGAAMSQSERLDSYSEFRVRLALDRQLDPALRNEMQRRVDGMAINPLDSSPRQEMKAALERYDWLRLQAENGQLANKLNRDRRTELAQYSETPAKILRDSLFHFATFGAYTHRVRPDPENLAKVDNYRRAQYQLNFLDKLSNQGTQPEVAYDTVRIQQSIAELKELMPEIDSVPMRLHAATTLRRLQQLSGNDALQADCSAAVASLEREPLPHTEGVALRIASPKILPLKP